MSPVKFSLFLVVAVLAPHLATAAVVGPYTADASTLHLWHFDEAATPCIDYGTVATATNLNYMINGAILGNASFSGFTNCISFGATAGYGDVIFNAGAGNVGAPLAFTYAGTNGAFTFEALVYVAFNPAASGSSIYQIMDCDSDNGATRVFQFRLDPIGSANNPNPGNVGIEFINGTTTVAVPPIPSGSIAQNNWYHVAVTYNGSPNTTSNLLFYWTPANSSATNAICIYGANMSGNLPDTDEATTVFSVGNSARNPSGGSGPDTGNFVGMIDELRISSVARASNQMLFGVVSTGIPIITSEPSPTNQVVSSGQNVEYSVTATGPLLTYLWAQNGSPLLNATNSSFTIASAVPSNSGNYDVVVTNSFGAATSTVVSLTVTNLEIITQPVSMAAAYAATVTFTVVAAGVEPFFYQWYENGAAVSGSTNSTLTVAPATNAGSFFAVVSNNFGSITSLTATLTLGSPPVFVPQNDEPNAPTGLLCDLLEHPELTVITTATPQFGWIYNPSFRNDFQTGCRIIVSSSPVLADEGVGDLWDSGMVGTSSSINVPYAGTALQTNTVYYWSVQTRDSAGQIGPLSAVQQFQTDTAFYTAGAELLYNVSTNTWANRYPISFSSASPVLVTNTSPGCWFVDFGQDSFGFATVQLNGTFNGSVVTALFGEMATTGPAVNPSPPSGSCVRYGTSSFTLSNGNVLYPVRPPSFNGDPDTQVVNPPASYGLVMPFRYFELSNCPADAVLTATNLTMQRLLYHFNTNAASFTSSSPALNQVWNLCWNSMQMLGFDGIYVDGDRERTPYEADSYIHQLSSYAVDREFSMVRYSFEYLLLHPTWPTEWKFHMILIAWADYLQTGNTNLLSTHYAALQPDCFTWAATGNGLMQGFPNYPQTTNSDIVDWPAGDRDGFVISSGSYLNYTNAVNNAFYYRCLLTMSNIATVLGLSSDAATYGADATQVYGAYNSALWNAGSQSYVDGVGTTHSAAHANFFPLDFGLVPATNRTAVLNYIHGRIAANGGMPPSVYGAQYMLEAMFQQNDEDTALGLMTTNGQRSWINMINMGSTLTTEAWNFTDKPNMDWNHSWGAAAGNLIQRYVLGVRPISAGYSQFIIQPELGVTLSYVQGVVPTVRGPVSLMASNGPGLFQLLVTIPGNSTATVMLPALGATNPAALVDGSVASAVLSNNWLIITNVGSGQHALWLNTSNTPPQITLYSNWAAAWFGTNANDPAIAGMAADPDGDGQDNYSEFIAGTDPTNPKSYFSIGNVALSNTLSVTLSGIAGRTYLLQYTTNLAVGPWIPVATNGPLTTSQTIQLSDPQASLPKAFYRACVTLP